VRIKERYEAHLNHEFCFYSSRSFVLTFLRAEDAAQEKGRCEEETLRAERRESISSKNTTEG
jgi:hypothetical protein